MAATYRNIISAILFVNNFIVDLSLSRSCVVH